MHAGTGMHAGTAYLRYLRKLMWLGLAALTGFGTVLLLPSSVKVMSDRITPMYGIHMVLPHRDPRYHTSACVNMSG